MKKTLTAVVLALAGAIGCTGSSVETSRPEDKLLENTSIAFPDGRQFQVIYDSNNSKKVRGSYSHPIGLQSFNTFASAGECFYLPGHEEVCQSHVLRYEIDPLSLFNLRDTLLFYNGLMQQLEILRNKRKN